MDTVPAEFVGLSQSQLQTLLTQTQEAISALVTGGKPVSVAFAQGDGSKSVTYTPANLPELRMRARILAELLGLRGPRRAIGVVF